jgi:multiple sugar transport system substrate-binding protein
MEPREPMPQLTRRTVLKSGAGAAAFAVTANLLTSRRSLAARDQKLVVWQQPNFNPTADRILEDQTRAFAKQAGLKDSEVQILKVPGGEIPTKMAAALEVGAPPDVTRLEEGYVARMRAQKALLDITDVMTEMKKVPGGVTPSVISLTEEGGRNYAVPMGLNPVVMHARMDLLEEAGYNAFPETWEKFIEASLKINKPPFYAYGMALGTSPGNDSNEDTMAVVWAQGGNIIDKQNHVVFNSPGSVKGFQLIKDMYSKHQIIPKGTLSWDNSGNNKAYQSKQVAFVYNPPSIYSYLLQEDKELAAKTGLFPAPGGPGGRVKRVYCDYYGVFKASPYPDIAKGLVRYLMEPKIYNEFITGTASRYLPVYPKLFDDPFWTSQKEFAGLVQIGRTGETFGRAGTITAALGEVVTQSVVPKAVQTVLVNNVDPAEAVAKAHAEILAIYKRFNEPG